jgi:hypothetical protein
VFCMNWNLVVSRLLAVSFLVCFVSGAMRWMDVHVISAYLTLVLAVAHVLGYRNLRN